MRWHGFSSSGLLLRAFHGSMLTTPDRFADRNPRGIGSRPRNREEVLLNSIGPDAPSPSPRDEASAAGWRGLGCRRPQI